MYTVIFLTPLHSIVTSRSHCCLVELSTALLTCSITRSNGIRSEKVSGSSALYTNHATPSTMISNTISYDPDPIRWSSWRKCNWYLGSWTAWRTGCLRSAHCTDFIWCTGCFRGATRRRLTSLIFCGLDLLGLRRAFNLDLLFSSVEICLRFDTAESPSTVAHDEPETCQGKNVQYEHVQDKQT